jgi:hypothetical protein
MQPGISPTTAAWLNVAFLICTGIAAGTVMFADIPVATVNIIKSVATDAAFGISCINFVFHAFASPAQGPLTKMLRR